MGSVPQNRSATNGFHWKSAHQSGGGERGSSRKRSPPEIRAPSQPESAPRQRFAGNPHAKAAAEGVPLRRIAGERPSEQRILYFEAGQARLVQRKKLAGKPCADLAGVRPAEELRRGRTCRASRSLSCGSVFVGKPRAGQTILRSVESSGVRPSGGFSVSKPVRRGSSNGMVLPGKSAEPVGAHPAVAFRRGNTRRVRESFAPRGWTILRSVESAGAASE